MKSRLQKGLLAGLAATIVVSLLEIPNLFLGWFDTFPGVLARTMGVSDTIGWVMHLAAGTLILGPLFGLLCPKLPTDTPETKGIVFAVGAFVIMMLGVWMIGGAGTFTGSSGFGAIAWLLITHAVFGIVLGNVYGRLVQRERVAARMAGAQPAH